MQTAASGHVLAVAVSAGTTYFKTYTSGILTSSACGTAVDHAVNIIGWGYNTTAGSYWIVRNSWGTSWGLSGYVNIGWGTNPGICGINSYVGYATA